MEDVLGSENENERNAAGGGNSKLLFGIAGVALLIAAWLVFAPGGKPTQSDEPEPESKPLASGPAPQSEPERGQEAEGATASGVDAAVPTKEWTAADYHAAGLAPPVEEMPEMILQELRRGTAPISDERRELMLRGMEEMPLRVQEDFDRARNPELPSGVLADFKDPYPPMPPGHEKYFSGAAVSAPEPSEP